MSEQVDNRKSFNVEIETVTGSRFFWTVKSSSVEAIVNRYDAMMRLTEVAFLYNRETGEAIKKDYIVFIGVTEIKEVQG